MKIEAPAEFHGLRDGLSHIRRREAEEGLSHVTARSLGALFESVIPPIPILTAAYGKRVSEIIQRLEGAPHKLHAGMFADRAGVDGTSIWAAATSGQSSIAMHLLACMLARIWKPTEAISLWVELVERRKQEIHEAYNDSNAAGIGAIMAAQQIFTREQLSAWDSSARSWLQTADTIKRPQQTQLMLIINNVRMPVNGSKEPYESVVRAWTSAMKAIERLISGVPQRVQDGSILLAISSWHLYPNMQVLAGEVKEIDQKDELMTDSVLTISVSGASATKEGVFWSLPLSRMRYYSPPVMAERHLASETSRITMEEFQVVFLGAVIAQWRQICSDEKRCCKLIACLYERFRIPKKVIPQWFVILANASLRILESDGPIQAQFLKLLKLGGRRCGAFLNDPGYKQPCFLGLEYFHVLIQSLDDVEDRINLLRRAAEARKLDHNDVIIRYKQPSRISLIENDSFEFSSAIPYTRSSHKRTIERCEISSFGHQRIAIGRCFKSEFSCADRFLSCGCVDPTGEECICKKNNSQCTENCHGDTSSCCSIDPPLPFECETGCSGEGSCAGCYNRITKTAAEKKGEEFFMVGPGSFKEFDESQFLIRKPGEEQMTTYEIILGDGQIAALFKRKSCATYDTYTKDFDDRPSATMNEIEAVVSSSSFNPKKMKLMSWGKNRSDRGSQQQLRSFRALVFASRLYEQMKGATVSIEVIGTPIHSVHWAAPLALTNEDWRRSKPFRRSLSPLDGHGEHDGLDSGFNPAVHELFRDETSMETLEEASGAFSVGSTEPDFSSPSSTIPEEKTERFERKRSVDMESLLARSFACIAWFDSGEFDITPRDLHRVIALANGDSIYVASALLVDPTIDTSEVPIKRVFGNIGRPQMSLLIPPSSPTIAEPNPCSWRLINHHTFDGTFPNCFTSTSLHLTFTDFEMPLDVGARGLRDRQVVLLESLVSIDDRGRNIGDLDVLSMFRNNGFSLQRVCSHPKEQTTECSGKDNVVSLDCWDEFLDLPRHIAIFRARDNWQARLGAAAASIQGGKRILVLPTAPCLQCVDDGVKNANADIIIA